MVELLEVEGFDEWVLVVVVGGGECGADVSGGYAVVVAVSGVGGVCPVVAAGLGAADDVGAGGGGLVEGV